MKPLAPFDSGPHGLPINRRNAMGREVRRVPANWEHPKDYRGNYKGLHDGSYAVVAAEWLLNCIAWANGTHEDFKDHPERQAKYAYYWEWNGRSPEKDDYMPDWPESERTHWQMYENVSEGTPISPPCESPEALARWLADNKASAGPYATADYETWLAMIHDGYAPSMVMQNGRIMSGVEFVGKQQKPE